MSKYYLYLIICFGFIACQKETSIENKVPPINIATGNLLDSAGNCKQILSFGSYKENIAMDNSNYIKANVTFKSTGNYTIYSDTVNGFWFVDSGYAFTTGDKILNIAAYGTPTMPTNANFTLHFADKKCYFTVLNNAVFVAPNTNNDYFPTTNNSSWVYFNSFINDTAIISVYPADKTIFGTKYRQFVLNIPSQMAYDTLLYRKDGAGGYYKYAAVGSGPKTEFAFLKDFPTVGTTWDSPIVQGTLSGNPTEVRYHFTLMDKNITEDVGLFTFDSIIKIKEETQYSENNIFTTKTTFIYSYQKKVGLVDVNQEGAVQNITIPITRWDVK